MMVIMGVSIFVASTSAAPGSNPEAVYPGFVKHDSGI
jgi:hypothetical protein